MAEQKVILIVDDDRELVDGLRAVLERQGYQGHPGPRRPAGQAGDLQPARPTWSSST